MNHIKLNQDSRDFIDNLRYGKSPLLKDSSRLNKKFKKFYDRSGYPTHPDIANAAINMASRMFKNSDCVYMLMEELKKVREDYVYAIRWTPPDKRWWGCKAMYKIGRSKDPEARCVFIRNKYRNKLNIFGEEGEFEVIASGKESAKLSELNLHSEFSWAHMTPKGGYEGGFFDYEVDGKWEWFDLGKGQDGIGDDGENKLLSYFPKPQLRDKKGCFLDASLTAFRELLDKQEQ